MVEGNIGDNRGGGVVKLEISEGGLLQGKPAPHHHLDPLGRLSFSYTQPKVTCLGGLLQGKPAPHHHLDPLGRLSFSYMQPKVTCLGGLLQGKPARTPPPPGSARSFNLPQSI